MHWTYKILRQFLRSYKSSLSHYLFQNPLLSLFYYLLSYSVCYTLSFLSRDVILSVDKITAGTGYNYFPLLLKSGVNLAIKKFIINK